MTDAADIAAGREAGSRIHQATSFESWKAIALALSIGRRQVLHEIKANAPYGTRYRRCFNAWLEENGFRTMPYNLRVACCRLVDNLSEIERFRAGLPETVRASQNIPEVIVRNWRRASG